MHKIFITRNLFRNQGRYFSSAVNYRECPIEDILNDFSMKVGFEIHAQMNSKRKLFSNAKATQLAEANSHVAALDLAMPGMLPVLNAECLNIAIKASLALNGQIAEKIKFDRKHYFYADLPQGYQITQKDHPIMQNGQLKYFDRHDKPNSLTIQRIQMEQDTARSFHDDPKLTYLDFNRAGMPLLEIVTEPEIHHPSDGKLAVKEIQDLLKSMDISEANMEEGQMRCDVNVSLKRKDGDLQGQRVEVKNVMGIRFVEKAIEFEMRRHAEALSKGDNVETETRRYDAATASTISMRSKEEDVDYRFLVDPDLPIFKINPRRINKIQERLTKVPFDQKLEMCDKYDLSVVDVQTIFLHPNTIPIFDSLAQSADRDARQVFMWLYQNLWGNVAKKDLDLEETLANNFQNGELLGGLIDLVSSKKVTASIAKDLMYDIIDGEFEGMTLQEIVTQEIGDIDQVIDFNALVKQVVASNQQTVTKILKKSSKKQKKGGGGPMMFLVGEVLKLSNKQGDPQEISTMIEEEIKNAQ